MSTTYDVSTTLRTISCSCGGVYAITVAHHQQCRQEGTSWTCPYCRVGWGFVGNSENERLKRELEAERERVERERRRAAAAEGKAERLEYRRRAAVGQVTKIKRRVANGVCPSCNRTFADLARHMASQHPGFTPTDSESDA